MPELIRSLAARLRELIGNRRSALRYAVRLRCGVTLLGDEGGRGNHNAQHGAAIEGHTFDLSASGVGLLLPAIRHGDQYLVGGARALRVDLQLDTGRTLRFDVLPVRYERAGEEEGGAGFLIGARITAMGDAERAQYVALLRRLKNIHAVTNRAATVTPANAN